MKDHQIYDLKDKKIVFKIFKISVIIPDALVVGDIVFVEVD